MDEFREEIRNNSIKKSLELIQEEKALQTQNPKTLINQNYKKIKNTTYTLKSVDFSYKNRITSIKLQKTILGTTTYSQKTKIFNLSKTAPYFQKTPPITLSPKTDNTISTDLAISKNFQNLQKTSGKVLIAYSDGKTRLFTCSNTLKTQKYITYTPHTKKVNKIKYINNSKNFITISNDCKIVITDIESEKRISVLDKHSNFLTSLAVSENEGIVYVGESSGYGAIWDLRVCQPVCDFNVDFREECRFLEGYGDYVVNDKVEFCHSKKIGFSSFDRFGYLLLTAGDDRCLKVWDLRKEKIVNSIPAHDRKIVFCDFYRDSNFVLSADCDGNFIAWNWWNSLIVNKFQIESRKMSCVSFNEEKDFFSAGFLGKKIELYDNIN